jgi:hypothetical protein
MKGIYMKEIKHLTLRGVGVVSKATLLSLGLVAIVTLVVVRGVLTAVVLTATALPATAVSNKRELRGRPESKNTAEISAPRKKAVAS